ncbi:Ribosomal large subunit pseudouridine synthase B [hydrothermal vent metagenome]|uniref:Ribosomal large subunit pseudouridine synthase B n=1 Tax=hydrothermal vent metagenome TaxID=652676 RepID=A0A3B0TIW5_9ZZZZ
MTKDRKTEIKEADAPERIAKVMARAGLASRRGAEAMIAEGRVTLNGKRLETPAVTVGRTDDIRVDGKRLPRPEPTRLWRYYKPRGLLTTNRDDDGRGTIFDKLPENLPRVISVGRLDMNTEGLLLLTNDGDLARYLELPDTGWLRRYRVRAYGRVEQSALDTLAKGPVIDGVVYGPVIAKVERHQGDNVWLTVDLREGKNREVKRVLATLGLAVNRLIRVSYGPFTLDRMTRGEVGEVPRRVLSQQVPARFRRTAETGGQGEGARPPMRKPPGGGRPARGAEPIGPGGGKPKRGGPPRSPSRPRKGGARPGAAKRGGSGIGRNADRRR